MSLIAQVATALTGSLLSAALCIWFVEWMIRREQAREIQTIHFHIGTFVILNPPPSWRHIFRGGGE
jgi:hypothetical protein